HDLNAKAGETFITNYPNPFVDNTTIQFETSGEHTLIQIFDTMGKLVKTLTDKEYSAGTYTLQFDATGLRSGTYYARLQNGLFQQMRTMVKVQ
ncbi:MAG TPA: T9SS type A sorting domain-containing protein, partial [Bacteroidia bacterium]|nr:T9SS type A sorting domain-containing protein [Bacteroidia bacterium]